jgi:hypothetical protein
MKIIIQKTFSFLITISAFCSCSSLGKIGIQVAVPPKYSVSNEIQSLAILDRSLTRRFSNIERDSLEKILVDHELDLDTIFLDSIAADTAIQVVAKALYESGRFDATVPEQRNITRRDFGGVLPPLEKEFIDTICKDFNTDGVLVLEDFSEKITTDFSTTRFNLEFGQSSNEYSGVINLLYKSVWRLYQPGLDPPILRFEVNDSIFWDSRDYSLKQMYDKLPSIKEALIGGGIASAEHMANDISPKWQDQDRKYYITGNKEIDAAIPLIKANKWEEAAEIWKKYTSVSSKSLLGKVEFNLALAAEMTGNIDLAIEWAVKSYKTKYTRTVDLYLEFLNQRKLILKKNF